MANISKKQDRSKKAAQGNCCVDCRAVDAPPIPVTQPPDTRPVGLEKLSVLQLAPASFKRSLDFVAGKECPKGDRSALVKQNSHRSGHDPSGSGCRLWLACSRTASTCFRPTPGNHARKSSMRAPASRFSNRALTGRRVPLKTQAPLTLRGSCSTAPHCDQSSISFHSISRLAHCGRQPAHATRNWGRNCSVCTIPGPFGSKSTLPDHSSRPSV